MAQSSIYTLLRRGTPRPRSPGIVFAGFPYLLQIGDHDIFVKYDTIRRGYTNIIWRAMKRLHLLEPNNVDNNPHFNLIE